HSLKSIYIWCWHDPQDRANTHYSVQLRSVVATYGSNKSVASRGAAFMLHVFLSPMMGECDDDPERALILPRRWGAVFRHVSGDFYAYRAQPFIVYLC
ncbi:MAG: hypothetical protein ACRCWS_05435, partial [Propionibacteriaceae bacterium]